MARRVVHKRGRRDDIWNIGWFPICHTDSLGMFLTDTRWRNVTCKRCLKQRGE